MEIWGPPAVRAATVGGRGHAEASAPAFSPGEALLHSGIHIASVFSSPALRCVQTAKHILEGQ